MTWQWREDVFTDAFEYARRSVWNCDIEKGKSMKIKVSETVESPPEIDPKTDALLFSIRNAFPPEYVVTVSIKGDEVVARAILKKEGRNGD